MITLTATDTLNTKVWNKNYGVMKFGIDNLYPNYSRIFSDNSAALKRVLKIYNYFVFGGGMTVENSFFKHKINVTGLRVDQLLRRLISEYGINDGVAVHVGYNAAYEKVSFSPIKFETVRLGEPDDFGVIKKVRIYKDWSASRITIKDIQEYDVYNPDPEIIAQQVENAGGWENWKGQVMYLGANGEVAYPHNKFHSVIEDVVTDIKMKNGRNANASTNFMPSHIVQLPFTFKDFADQTGQTEDTVKDAMVESLKKYQSCDNLGKIMLLENGIKDKDGKMVEFKIDKLDLQSYDELFEHTEQTVKDSIRGVYSVPEILLDTVATGFSTEIMESAYNYYNNITAFDRQLFEELFTELFSNYRFPNIVPIEFKITPLKYLSNE